MWPHRYQLRGSAEEAGIQLEVLDDEGFYELFYLYVALLVLRFAPRETAIEYRPEMLDDESDPFESAKRELVDRALVYESVFGHILEDPYTVEKVANVLRPLKEDPLIREILFPLLRRMGYVGMRAPSHGPFEFGQDIRLFSKVNDFGIREYYAVQAKALKIHNTSGKEGNVADISGQIETALVSPFTDLADNTEKRIDHALLITNKEIVESARRFIANKFPNRKVIPIDLIALSELVVYYGLAQEVIGR